MKTIRILSHKWYVSLPLAIVMFLSTSCSKEAPAARPVDTVSGQDIFKGIFFADGDFASKLSSQRSKHELFATLDQETREQLQKKINLVVDLIEKESPEFFNEFKQKISSKDHFLVKQALGEGAKHIADNFEKAFPEMVPLAAKIQDDIKNKIITTDGKIDPAKVERQKLEYDKLLSNNMITSSSPKRACTIGLVCVVYIALAVHSYAAISTVAAVAIMTWKYIAFLPADVEARQSEGDPLELEMIIDEIVKL